MIGEKLIKRITEKLKLFHLKWQYNLSKESTQILSQIPEKDYAYFLEQIAPEDELLKYQALEGLEHQERISLLQNFNFWVVGKEQVTHRPESLRISVNYSQEIIAKILEFARKYSFTLQPEVKIYRTMKSKIPVLQCTTPSGGRVNILIEADWADALISPHGLTREIKKFLSGDKRKDKIT